jgi:hypothetical protein
MSSVGRVGQAHRGGLASPGRAIVVPVLLIAAGCGSGVQDTAAKTTDSTALSNTRSKPPVQYTYQIVDVPGATETRGSKISDLGVTVGDYTDADGAQHAFIRSTSGNVTTVDILGAVGITLRGKTTLGLASASIAWSMRRTPAQ